MTTSQREDSLKPRRGRPPLSRDEKRKRHLAEHPHIVESCRRCRARVRARTIDYSKRVYRHPPRPDAWDQSECDRLRELLGKYTPAEMAAVLNRELHALDDGIWRTEKAVAVKIKKLGLSRRMFGLRLLDVERIFGTDHRVIYRNWMAPGLLVPARTFPGRGYCKTVNYCFTEDDLERFVRAYPWEYDYRRIGVRSGLPPDARLIADRLRRLGEERWRSAGLLTRDEVLRAMGWKSDQPWKLWIIKRHLVPVYRRFRTDTRKQDGIAFVRAADLVGLKERIAELSHEHHSAARRGRSAWNRGKAGTGGPIGMITVMRCFVCAAKIVRKRVLPLHCPECGEVAWNPTDIPHLDIYEDARGGIHVRRWSVA